MDPYSKLHMGSFLLFLFFASALAISSVSASNGITVYEILTQYGLPRGLLPDSVKKFSHTEDGNFVVELEKPCYIQFENMVSYDQKITGTIKYGSITNLDGIKVKRFFLWLDVQEIRVDLPPSGFVYFQVGLINKKLDAGQFQTVQSCKDGLSCQGFWKDILKVPTPIKEVPMLLTE
ncbi:uncharacterized protein LOC122641511 [Telopea speciosissima]|uniref:uncharacterized protein LOC122641511 n=1 Tax=Telopea speciosissima TaxID=54955 RepID=UPI001CC371C4|nr:uncharacterized protein LOC122641511 [Telopea speciosissima]